MKAAGAESSHPTTSSASPGAVLNGTWLVLGGGGLKGLAHIGAWQALQEAGVRPAGIVGTSIGALIGTLAASGMSVEAMRSHGRALKRADIARVNRRAVWINGIRQSSIFHGAALRAHLSKVLPKAGWDALRIPMLMNAVDLRDGSTAWFGTGARNDLSLVDAVYASSALPVFYPPCEVDGHAYVDGGVLQTLPLARAEDAGATRIIAVDVGAAGEADVRAVVGAGMIAIHQRTLAIMMGERRRERVTAWSGVPLVYVRPKLAGYGTFDFGHIPYFIDEGYRATREAIAAT